MNTISFYKSKKVDVTESDKGNNIDPTTTNINHMEKESFFIKEIKEKKIDFANKDLLYLAIDEKSLSEKKDSKLSSMKGPKEKEVNRWQDFIERLSLEDLSILKEEGSSFKEYDIDHLEKAIERIKAQRKVKKENVQRQIKNNKEKIEDIRSVSGYRKELIDRLEEKGLPITKNNIVKVSNVLEMATVIPNLSEQAMEYLISENKELSIENIYKGMYLSTSNPTPKLKEEKQGNDSIIYKALADQIKNKIEKSGLPPTNENTKNARWLLEKDIPVTETNLWKLKDLILIKNEMTNEEIINRMIDSLQVGYPLEKTNLTMIPYKKLIDNIKDFNKLDLNKLNYLQESIVYYSKNKNKGDYDLNLQQLKEIEEKVELNNNIKSFPQELKEVDINTISLRRNIEEIRLKLTVESGRQLIKNGINLETDKLSKIVDGLRHIENEYYSYLLLEGNMENEHLDSLKNVLDSVDKVKNLPVSMLGQSYLNRKELSINNLIEEGKKHYDDKQLINKSYESFITKPNRSLGDHIEKAFQNIDNILDSLDLERTEGNKRAVRILGHNRMDISKENILDIKIYDNEVDYLIKNLRPSMVVDFIKDGINPLEVPIKDLNKLIKDKRESSSSFDEDKFSKYLWKLEKNHNITESERESYIGIYRLINQINKEKEIALGAVIKADQNLNLKNLLTAIRTRKKGDFDKSVDNYFGLLDTLKKETGNIDRQIETGLPLANTYKEKLYELNSQVIDKIYHELSPEKLYKVKDYDLYNLFLEKLYDELEKIPNNKELEEEHLKTELENFKSILKSEKGVIEYLDRFNITNSINYIKAASDQMSQDYNFYKEWNIFLKDKNEADIYEKVNLETISKNIINNLSKEETLREEYQNLEKEVKKICKDMVDRVASMKDLKQIQRLSNGISFIKLLADKRHYKIPMVVGDELTNVNLTIVSNKDEKGRVRMEVNSPKLSFITIDLQVNNESLKGFFTCDNKESLEKMKDKNSDLLNKIDEDKIQDKYIYYSLEKQKEDKIFYDIEGRSAHTIKTNFNGYKNPELHKENIKEDIVPTDLLYRLSKTILFHIKDIENT